MKMIVISPTAGLIQEQIEILKEIYNSFFNQNNQNNQNNQTPWEEIKAPLGGFTPNEENEIFWDYEKRIQENPDHKELWVFVAKEMNLLYLMSREDENSCESPAIIILRKNRETDRWE